MSGTLHLPGLRAADRHGIRSRDALLAGVWKHAKDARPDLPEGKVVTVGVIAGSLAALTASSAGVSSRRRRAATGGARDHS